MATKGPTTIYLSDEAKLRLGKLAENDDRSVSNMVERLVNVRWEVYLKTVRTGDARVGGEEHEPA